MPNLLRGSQADVVRGERRETGGVVVGGTVGAPNVARNCAVPD
jgi:hypothetical protein